MRRSKFEQCKITSFIAPLAMLLAVMFSSDIAHAANQAAATLTSQAQDANHSSTAPQTITLQDALQRARSNSPEFQAALTEFGLAREDRVQSRAALLPSVTYNGQFVYTQGNGTSAGRFIANNGVHEYISQGNAHQVVSYADISDFRRARAVEAAARAKAEIATRGLVATVVKLYYGLLIAERKYATAQLASAEAEKFLQISQKLEKGGEVAHSDVVKAHLQFQQKSRDLQEAQLAMETTRLDLAILLFPDFNQNFTVVDDLQSPQAIPTFDEAQTMAARDNPELRVALANFQAAKHEVQVAWGGIMPTLSMDYFYGIDASHFAVSQFDPVSGQNVRNLGYQASATLQLPIWNWGAGRSKIKQADLREHQSQVELTFAQKQALSNLREFYSEVKTSRAELESLNQSAELAAESLRLTNLRYQAGEATVLEVVDAQNTLTQVRNADDDGQARFRLAIANLQTLTGSF
jgi:outer membrane protein TolC